MQMSNTSVCRSLQKQKEEPRFGNVKLLKEYLGGRAIGGGQAKVISFSLPCDEFPQSVGANAQPH
jgi:hypothetical protein